MYWLGLNMQHHEKGIEIEEEIPLLEENELNFCSGKKIDELPGDLTCFLERHYSGIWTDNLLLYAIEGLVLNKKARDIVNGLGVTNIDYYPLKIIKKDGAIVDDYHIGNIIGVVDCIDRDNSEIEYSYGEIDFIDKLVLHKEKIPQASKVFRIKGKELLAVFHDDVKRAFEDEGISGITFVKPEDLRF